MRVGDDLVVICCCIEVQFAAAEMLTYLKRQCENDVLAMTFNIFTAV